MQASVKVIIPAYNEEQSIPLVVNDIPDFVEEIIVVNNNSTDHTEINAKKAGAIVLFEARKGYGYACLKGLEYINQQDSKPDIIVFLDGDYSDFPEEMLHLLYPIIDKNYDFVVGSRVSEYREKGAMTFPQRFGNWLATFLMRILYQANYTDLGPFRAIKFEKLIALKMQDKTYGWTIEMQLKALKHRLKYTEVPVHYRNRIGASKVSGTVKGAFMAGVKILAWIFKYGIKK
ncbi:MAG: glycosyltransferase family 2 protein [Bacteroidota bacterium]